MTQYNYNWGTKNRILDQIYEEIVIEIQETMIGYNYKDLLSAYKAKKVFFDRSGNGSVNRKYLDIFDKVIGKDI